MFSHAQIMMFNKMTGEGMFPCRTGLLTVDSSAVPLTALAGVHFVRTGKGNVANLAAERDLSVVNALKIFSLIFAVEVSVHLA